jgi:thymidylate synthase ThyX
MESIFDGEVDCFQPMVVRENQQLLDFFNETVTAEVENVNKCLDAGISRKDAVSLIPNSYNIRLIETGDGLDYIHRRKLRLCSNAQEEIFFMDLEQTQQTLEVFPEMKNVLMAPCGLRKKLDKRHFVLRVKDIVVNQCGILISMNLEKKELYEREGEVYSF